MVSTRRFRSDDWYVIVAVLHRELGDKRARSAIALAGEGMTGERVKGLIRTAREARSYGLLKALDIALAEVAKR